MNPNFKNYLLKATKASDCRETELIQSLWSGYGKISRFELQNAPYKTVVIKCIALHQSTSHPRGWNTSNSHRRKLKSYEVETSWYENWNQRCTTNCRVPAFLGSFSANYEQWIILEDLDTNYPLRKDSTSLEELKVCLNWLANFHATFLGEKPSDLWEVGTYWHLDTRPDEFENIQDQDLKSKAYLIDGFLKDAKYQTIVHGDAKLANFCFSQDGTEVAAVDFQYVGDGCGMKDVAYLIGSCLSGSNAQLHEEELLAFYFTAMREAMKLKDSYLDFNELEQEWRRLFPLASADFTRFLLGWMPSHQKVNDYSMKVLRTVLSNL